MFEVTVKGVVPADDETAWFEGVTESAGEAWETVTTIGARPVTVTVTLATRELVVLLME